jgi:hypothetical protein
MSLASPWGRSAAVTNGSAHCGGKCDGCAKISPMNVATALIVACRRLLFHVLRALRRRRQGGQHEQDARGREQAERRRSARGARHGCCSRPPISTGLLDRRRERAWIAELAVDALPIRSQRWWCARQRGQRESRADIVIMEIDDIDRRRFSFATFSAAAGVPSARPPAAAMVAPSVSRNWHRLRDVDFPSVMTDPPEHFFLVLAL